MGGGGFVRVRVPLRLPLFIFSNLLHRTVYVVIFECLFSCAYFVFILLLVLLYQRFSVDMVYHSISFNGPQDNIYYASIH